MNFLFLLQCCNLIFQWNTHAPTVLWLTSHINTTSQHPLLLTEMNSCSGCKMNVSFLYFVIFFFNFTLTHQCHEKISATILNLEMSPSPSPWTIKIVALREKDLKDSSYFLHCYIRSSSIFQFIFFCHHNKSLSEPPDRI